VCVCVCVFVDMQRLKKRYLTDTKYIDIYFYCVCSDDAMIIAILFFRVLSFVNVFILIQTT